MLPEKRIKNALFVVLFCTLTPLLSYADTVLTITSGRSEPFVTPEKNGFYDLIVKNMFQRTGIKAETVLLPSERSLINANTGVDDGNIARIKGIEKKYKNLIMVPEKIIDFDFVAFRGQDARCIQEPHGHEHLGFTVQSVGRLNKDHVSHSQYCLLCNCTYIYSLREGIEKKIVGPLAEAMEVA